MQKWLLDEKIKWDDIDFINGCGIDYTLTDPMLPSISDSGWCDATTGHRMPTATMRVTFTVLTKRDLHILKLKFGDAIIALNTFTELSD